MTRFLADNLRAYWKIVVDGQNDELTIYKDISIWMPTPGIRPSAYRIMYRRFDLTPKVKLCRSNDDPTLTPELAHRAGWISFGTDGIELKDCYLKVEDRGLQHQLYIMTKGIPATNFFPSNLPFLTSNQTVDRLFTKLVKQPYLTPEDIEREIEEAHISSEMRMSLLQALELYKAIGTIASNNIMAYVADIDLNIEVICKPQNNNGEYPILYFPMNLQNPMGRNRLYLGLDHTQWGQSILWKIGQENCRTTEIFTGDYLRSILVRQKQNALEDISTRTFELYTDTLPAYTNCLFTERADFSFGPQTFYVGYNRDSEKRYSGTIERITFDPNSSCAGCTE